MGVLGDELLNEANLILPQSTLVAMTTKSVKFGQNWLKLGLHSSSIDSPKYLWPDIYITVQERCMVNTDHP